LQQGHDAERFRHLRTISVKGGFSPWQRALILASLLAFILGAVYTPIETIAAVLALLIFIFGMIMVLKLLLSLRSGGMEPLPDRLLTDEECSPYTVLVALYREAAVLPQLIKNLCAMDYPKDRLQILVLLEEDDGETRRAVAHLQLPQNFEVVIVPRREPGPRCKPRALEFARRERVRGEFIVIYDAEDRPEPDQIRKAATLFARSGQDLACLQAELRWYNADETLITRMAAGSYANTFGLILPGLSRNNGVVPLGGTSCHIRSSALALVGGWDPYNVTEDLDLGVKLRRAGLRVAMLPSLTWEEAPLTVTATVRQYSRWIKGHTATLVAHSRNPFRLYRDLGPFAFLSFLLIIGAAHVATLAAPVFWGMLIAYILTGAHLIELLIPPPAFYVGSVCLLGNFLFAWQATFACIITGQYKMVLWMFLLPIFWMTVLPAAALKAAWEIASGRFYYWDKTEHGLSLKTETVREAASERDITRPTA